jgi:CRP-like cAMP-binding protein
MPNPLSALAIASSSSFLTGLAEPAIRAILARAKIRRISAKDNIVTRGQRATHLFLVQSGRVQYYHLTKDGDSVVLAWMTQGDVVGLTAMLDGPSTYMATADATSDGELLAWERSVIRQLASTYPALGENGLRIALSVLRSYVQRHIGLVTKTAQERLAETLLSLGDKSGEVHPDGIEIHATNDQLGALADVSAFTASRVLGAWEREGILSKGRGRVLLHSPEGLMLP